MRCQPYQIVDHNYLVVVCAASKKENRNVQQRIVSLFPLLNHKRNLWIKKARFNVWFYLLLTIYLHSCHDSFASSRITASSVNESKRVTDFYANHFSLLWANNDSRERMRRTSYRNKASLSSLKTSLMISRNTRDIFWCPMRINIFVPSAHGKLRQKFQIWQFFSSFSLFISTFWQH